MAGKPHKLTFKRLVRSCQKDFKEMKLSFNMLSEEDQVLKILSIILHKIYSRNYRRIDALKFSDFLIAEPYLDYHFYKICKEIDYSGHPAEGKLRRKPFNKQFGIYDIKKLEKSKSLKIPTGPVLSEKDFKEKLKNSS